jgi:pyruvate dehydrogenase E1 component
VDAESIVVAALDQLYRRGEIAGEVVARAIRELGIDPGKPDPTKV